MVFEGWLETTNEREEEVKDKLFSVLGNWWMEAPAEAIKKRGGRAGLERTIKSTLARV